MAIDLRKKLTQAELATLFGVSVQTIQNWINRDKIPHDCCLSDIGMLTKEFLSNKNNVHAIQSTTKSQRDEVKLNLDKVALAAKTNVLVDSDKITKKLSDIALKYVDLTKTLCVNIQAIVVKNAPPETANLMSLEIEHKLKRFTSETSELFK